MTISPALQARTDCLAVVDVETWEKVQQRLKERVTGQRHGQPERYFLSGPLVCERCGARLVLTCKPARYACGTFLYGGRAAVFDINGALQGNNV